jgi:hypothetical protein
LIVQTASARAKKDATVELPLAFICHESVGRLRIKVASCRGDAGYFERVVKSLSGLRKFATLSANPLTGSLLFSGDNLDTGKIAAFSREHALFELATTQQTPSPPIMHSLVQPVASIDRSLRTVTGGKIDLPTGIFLGLLGSGIYQLARGRFSAPPWYTAFWYAFGLFSTYVIEKAVEGKAARLAD